MQESKNSVPSGDYVTASVPANDRRPLLELILNLSGGPICVAALFAGAFLSSQHSFVHGATAVLLGGLLLAVYGGAIGTISFRTGLPTGMLLRRAFGDQGSKVVSAALALCLTGWFAVQTGLFGDTIHLMFPNGGIVTSSWLASLWGGILMLSTAYFGYRGLSLLSVFAVPLLFVLTVVGLAKAIGKTDLLAYVPGSTASIGDAVTFVVGAVAVGTTSIGDYLRYARRESHVWVASGASLLIVNSFMIMAGFATAVATGSGDLLAAMVALGLGVPALLVLILGQWTTNDDNLYSSSLTVSTVMPGFRKPIVVLVLGLSATLCASLGVAQHFVPFLVGLGIAIPPVGGILITDFFVVRKGERRSRAYSLPAFVAWGAGISAGIFLPFGIPAINSILGAGIVHAFLARSFHKV